MSSRKYAAPLRLEPEPSRRLALTLGAAVIGALLLPLAIPLGWHFRLGIWIVVLLLAARAYRRHAGAQRITRAVWDEHGQWHLWSGGETWEAKLEGDSLVTPELVILNFRAEQRRDPLVILGDSLEPGTCRRLRVRLRLEGCREEDSLMAGLLGVGKSERSAEDAKDAEKN